MDALLATYRAALALCAVGVGVSTLEYWAVARAFRPDGLYSWDILQLRYGVPYLSGIVGFHERAVRGLLVGRLAALVLALATPLGGPWFSGAMGLLVVTNLVFSWRRGFGDDGSDQMTAMILLTFFLCVGPHSTPFILKTGLWFIALQACLAYTTAGLAKLGSPTWRRGEAVHRIFSTRTYGLQAAARLLEPRRWLRLALCWIVILMETLFPLSLLLPTPWTWIFLGWGALFHLLCAVVMGFNSFLWAFVTTYPAIVYASSTAAGWLRGA
jgi:hypothetical protein